MMIMIRLFFTTFSLFSRLLLFNFKVTFEGVRGPDYRGDIAVDDIFFEDCNAPVPTLPSKGKLTVPRSSILDSRSSIRTSRIEARVEFRDVRVLSRSFRDNF